MRTLAVRKLVLAILLLPSALVLGNSSETTEFSGDFDGDGRVAPLTDGLLAIRYMFGFDGPALTAGALGEGATREDPDLVFAYAEKNRDQLDLDLDGSVGALTDGLLLIRYLFGFSGESLVASALSSEAKVGSAAEISNTLASMIDRDNDGVINSRDFFPDDPSEWFDTDRDGIGNNADPDDDGDGLLDLDDPFPLDASELLDTDGDGIGDNSDEDDDGDGVADQFDAFPLDALILISMGSVIVPMTTTMVMA